MTGLGRPRAEGPSGAPAPGFLFVPHRLSQVPGPRTGREGGELMDGCCRGEGLTWGGCGRRG